jgi:23S rRNA (guanosine2251-2'-O)-methyltransferase
MTKKDNKRRIAFEYEKEQAKRTKKERPQREVREEKEINENVIEGRNPILEAFDSKITVEKILVSKGDNQGSIIKIMSIAKERGIPVIEVDRRKLDTVANTPQHQGVVAYITPYRYVEVADILAIAKDKGEKPFVMILDEIEDPHNLGSIIRTAELCGVHGVIIPKRRSVGVNSTVFKTSAGAVNHMAISKVTNIARVIDELKEEGVFVYGADMNGDSRSHETNFSGGVGLVIGNEGKGLSRLVREKCDGIVSIPMVGKVNSLNASVAAGILMYEVMKSRL